MCSVHQPHSKPRPPARTRRYLERDGKGAADEETAIRRANAGLSDKEDKFVLRVGPRARGVIGTPALLHFACAVAGVAEPAGKPLRQALGPESLGVAACREERKPKAPKPGRDDDRDGDDGDGGGAARKKSKA